MKLSFAPAVLTGVLCAALFLNPTRATEPPSRSAPLSPAHVGQPGYSNNLSLLATPSPKTLQSSVALPTFVPNNGATAEARRVELVKPADLPNFRFDQRLSSPTPAETAGKVRSLDFHQRYQFLFQKLE
jgi:hypothetical protein